jgi:hypothetical protein
MTEELWKDIKDFEGMYMISNLGNVKSLKRKCVKEDKILKPGKDRCGYFFVILNKDGKGQTCKIHRLVGIAFLDPVDSCKSIDHINRIKTDNRVENLRWADRTMQSQNRDYVFNAKHLYISYDKKPMIVSHWRVLWRYDGESQKNKYFLNKDLAEAFAETLDKTRLIPIKSKSL